MEAGLRAGHLVLKDGGRDAVTAAVVALEDEPLFNAGRGAVFASDGRLEMDAAVMDGRDHKAGAVTGVMGPRKPVLAARALMERSEHVLLVCGCDRVLSAVRGALGRLRLLIYRGSLATLLAELERLRKITPEACVPPVKPWHCGCPVMVICNLDGWNDGEACGSGRRYPDVRCRHLGGQRDMCGFRDGRRRIFHSLGARA